MRFCSPNKNLCRDDTIALDLIDQVTRGQHGGDRKSEDIKIDNIQLDSPPTGNARAQAPRLLHEPGEIGRGRDRGSVTTSIESDRGADYLTARIACDNPSVSRAFDTFSAACIIGITKVSNGSDTFVSHVQAKTTPTYHEQLIPSRYRTVVRYHLSHPSIRGVRVIPTVETHLHAMGQNEAAA